MCNKRRTVFTVLCALNHDATESLSLSQICHKQTDDGRVVDITCILAVAKFSQSRVWSKIPEGSTLIFEGT